MARNLRVEPIQLPVLYTNVAYCILVLSSLLYIISLATPEWVVISETGSDFGYSFENIVSVSGDISGSSDTSVSDSRSLMETGPQSWSLTCGSTTRASASDPASTCNFEFLTLCRRTHEARLKHKDCALCTACEKANGPTKALIILSIIWSFLGLGGVCRNWWFGWHSHDRLSRMGAVGSIGSALCSFIAIVVYGSLVTPEYKQGTIPSDFEGGLVASITHSNTLGYSWGMACLGFLVSLTSGIMQLMTIRGMTEHRFVVYIFRKFRAYINSLVGRYEFIRRNHLIQGRFTVRNGDLVFISSKSRLDAHVKIPPRFLKVAKGLDRASYVNRWDRIGILWKSEEGDPHHVPDDANRRPLRNFYVLELSATGELVVQLFQTFLFDELSDVAVMRLKLDKVKRETKQQRRERYMSTQQTFQQSLADIVRDPEEVILTTKLALRKALESIAADEMSAVGAAFTDAGGSDTSAARVSEIAPLIERVYKHKPRPQEVDNLVRSVGAPTSDKIALPDFVELWRHLESKRRRDNEVHEDVVHDLICGAFVAAAYQKLGLIASELDLSEGRKILEGNSSASSSASVDITEFKPFTIAGWIKCTKIPLLLGVVREGLLPVVKKIVVRERV